MKRVIALLCVLGLLWVVPPAFAEELDPLEDALLGTVSQKYESNGDPGLISGGIGDLGGASYGAYQFASKSGVPFVFAKWCVSSGLGVSVGNRLCDAYAKDGDSYSTNFNAQWKAIAAEDASGFYRLQRLYTREKYYLPAVKAFQEYLNLDVNQYGIALKNAVWSRTLQHGLGSYTNRTGFMGIMRRVEEALPQGALTTTPEQTLITAIYEESGAVVESGTNPMLAASAGSNAWIIEKYQLEGKYMKYYSGNSAAVQAGVYLRLRVNEPKDLLAMLAQYGGYGGASNFGELMPTFQWPILTLTDGSRLNGIYTDANTAVTAENMDDKSVIVFSPKNYDSYDEPVVMNLGGSLKMPIEWNGSGFASIQMSLCLELPQSENAVLQLNMNEATLQYDLTGLADGWHTLTLPVPALQTVTRVPTIEIVFTSLLGAVAIDCIQAVAQPTATYTAKINTSDDDLNCRTKPTTSGELLGRFPKGSTVTLLGGDVDGWFMCYGTNTDGSVMLGWCSGDYLSDRKPLGLLSGDVNGNNQIEATDALWILQHTVGKRQFTPDQLTAGDLNDDGKADAADALQVLRIVVGKA
ncbi:MAG: SH3 domain-containing protein [Clostridia bacterium]|nr:SH3 domain-containing protein [Clostridia bacterium]